MNATSTLKRKYPSLYRMCNFCHKKHVDLGLLDDLATPGTNNPYRRCDIPEVVAIHINRNLHNLSKQYPHLVLDMDDEMYRFLISTPEVYNRRQLNAIFKTYSELFSAAHPETHTPFNPATQWDPTLQIYPDWNTLLIYYADDFYSHIVDDCTYPIDQYTFSETLDEAEFKRLDGCVVDDPLHPRTGGIDDGWDSWYTE